MVKTKLAGEWRCRTLRFLLLCGAAGLWAGDAYADPPVIESIKIDNDEYFTINRTVTLNHTWSGGHPTQYKASEFSDFRDMPDWATWSEAPSFELSTGYEYKYVYFKLKNGDGESPESKVDVIWYFKSVEFADRLWGIDISSPSRMSDSTGPTGNVEVDAQGRLHMRVTRHDEFLPPKWLGAQVISAVPTRPGVHRFRIESLGTMDRHVNATPYLAWHDPNQTINGATWELDLETYWEASFGAMTHHFFVGNAPTNPRTAPICMGAFPVAGLSTTSHYLDWHNGGPDRSYILFRCFHGYGTEPDEAGQPIAEGFYQGLRNPPKDVNGEPYMRIEICNVPYDDPYDPDNPDGLDFIIAGADLPPVDPQTGQVTPLNVYFDPEAANGGQPLINEQSATATILVGESPTISIAATTSQGELAYRWQKDGIDLPTDGGSNSHYYDSGTGLVTTTQPTLRIVSLAQGDPAGYRCRVTQKDAAGDPVPSDSVMSAVATLQGRGEIPDFDADNDVDLDDFTHFRGCFNGPNRTPASGGCGDADLDLDADVDLEDFAHFRSCFNGVNRPPACEGLVGDSASIQGDSLLAGMDTLDDLGSFEVAFDIQSPQANDSVTAGTPIEWHANVCVTGDSQGLGGFAYSLFLGPDTGPGPGADGVWGTADDENLADVVLDVASWSEAYAVTGADGKPTVGAGVTAVGNCGGPGMNVMPSAGYNDRAGALLQVGSAHLSWDPWRYLSGGKNPGWYGDHTWGVGLDDRKDDLLLNTAGAYELNVGWIDTTNLAPGHYVLTLVPASRIDLLRPDVDLSVPQSAGILTGASSVSGPVSIELDIEE